MSTYPTCLHNDDCANAPVMVALLWLCPGDNGDHHSDNLPPRPIYRQRPLNSTIMIDSSGDPSQQMRQTRTADPSQLQDGFQIGRHVYVLYLVHIYTSNTSSGAL